MTDADVASLRVHWSEGEAVEIAAVVGTFNYFNRFNDAFGVEPTKPGEGLES
jgi:alkylhydroperoxidase family enzyme